MDKIRGFEVITQYADVKWMKLPERKTAQSAGYDIYSPEYVTCQPNQITVIPTGIKAYMQSNEYLGIHLRSSIAIKRGLMLVNSQGIIDADYYNNPENEGHILIAVYNPTEYIVQIDRGERVAQGVFYNFLTVDNDNATGERVGGIGSTTKKRSKEKQ